VFHRPHRLAIDRRVGGHLGGLGAEGDVDERPRPSARTSCGPSPRRVAVAHGAGRHRERGVIKAGREERQHARLAQSKSVGVGGQSHCAPQLIDGARSDPEDQLFGGVQPDGDPSVRQLVDLRGDRGAELGCLADHQVGPEGADGFA
jgi:hypothetical protein